MNYVWFSTFYYPKIRDIVFSSNEPLKNLLQEPQDDTE